MEKVMNRVIIFLMCGVLLTVITGCEPEGAGNTKKERLYAVENMQLKENIQEQKSMLEKCEKDKKELEKFAAKGMGDFADEEVMVDMLEEIGQLRIENQKLKEEIEQLKKDSPSEIAEK